MNNKLAPISISTYSRLEHLKKTVEALKMNTLAQESVLYIFSDAPRKGDEEIVAQVRAYCHSIEGFKEVNIIEQAVNNMQKNMQDACEIPLNKYGKMIRMEDDIVTGPGFLQFINDGLKIYQDDKRIFSIGGFSPVNHNNHNDIYFSQRAQCWGFGIWKDRFDRIKLLPSFLEIKQDKQTLKRLRKMGDDMIPMIKDESEKQFAMDIRCCYWCAKENLFNILPSNSLVKNIGLDGSGVHCGVIDIYDNLSVSNKIDFDFNVEYNEKYNCQYINKNNKVYQKRSLLVRAVNKLARMTLEKNLIK
jgi:hypothetical protein